jgi:hypothetical protein
MGHPDGAHTHGGGGFDPMPILIIIGAIAVAGPVAAAVVELLHILLIAVVVILSLGAVGLAAVIAFRVHRWRAGAPARVSLPAPTVVRAVQAPREPQPTIERAHEVHLHLHGVTAEDVAAIIARQTGRDGG